MSPLLLALCCYLVGSFPSAYLIARAYGRLDIRRVGTGNVGATNVVRNVGWGPGVLTALVDVGKGLGVVVLARATGAGTWRPLLGLVCAIVGHNWPVWLRFHGGGGLATFCGGLLLLVPFWQFVLAGSLYGLVYLVTRHKYFSSLFMCGLLPVWLGGTALSWDYFLFGLAGGVALGYKQARAWVKYGGRRR